MNQDRVNSGYLKVQVPPELLISHNKFSGTGKVTLRYQKSEIKGTEISVK